VAETRPKSAEKAAELLAALSSCRSHFAAAALFSLAINVLYLASPLYLLQVYDRVIPSGSNVTLLMLTAVLLVAIGALAALDLLRGRVLGRASLRLDRVLGDRLLAASVDRDTGRGLRSQGLRDLDTLRQYLTGGSLQAAFDLPWVPIYLAFIFLLHPLLGAFATGSVLVLVALALANEWITRAPLREGNEASARSFAFAEASLRNSEVVTALGMVRGLATRWRRDRDRMLSAQTAGADRAAAIASLIRFLRLSMQSVVLGLGAFLAVERLTTVGVIFAASVILGRALQPVEVIVGSWRNSVSAKGSYDRLAILLAGTGRPDVPLVLPRPSGALSVDGVYVTTPGHPGFVLNNVSFRLAAGETLGIVGPSGAGKSTLARAILGVVKPKSGAVRLDGADTSAWPHETLGAFVGYLPQDIELFAETVAANICRFQADADAAIVRAAQLARAHDLILRLPDGYETMVGEGGSFLSGGHRQRVALARAVFGTPSLVVLDEPSSNLDVEGEGALNECIAELRRSGVTVIIVSHRPATLALADKILVLRNGAVEAFGNRAEVLGGIVRPPGIPPAAAPRAGTAVAAR
jgi:ATP-binding cassette subfamily C protein